MSSTPAWHVFKKLDLAGFTCAEKGTIRTASRADCGGLRMRFLYASDNKIQRAGVRSRTRIFEGGAANRHKVGFGTRQRTRDLSRPSCRRIFSVRALAQTEKTGGSHLSKIRPSGFRMPQHPFD